MCHFKTSVASSASRESGCNDLGHKIEAVLGKRKAGYIRVKACAVLFALDPFLVEQCVVRSIAKPVYRPRAGIPHEYPKKRKKQQQRENEDGSGSRSSVYLGAVYLFIIFFYWCGSRVDYLLCASLRTYHFLSEQQHLRTFSIHVAKHLL